MKKTKKRELENMMKWKSIGYKVYKIVQKVFLNISLVAVSLSLYLS